MGLLGDFAIGAAAGAAKAGADISYDMIKADIEEAKRARLMEMESRIKDDRDRAAEERAKTSKRQDSEALQTEVGKRTDERAGGLLSAKYDGANVSGADMAALPPEARSIYERDVGAPSEMDKARIGMESATALNQNTQADNYRGQFNAERQLKADEDRFTTSQANISRQEAADKNRHLDSMKRLDAQIANSVAATTKGDKHNSDAETRSRASALNNVLKENGDQILKYETLSAADPEAGAKYKPKIDALAKESAAISATLKSYGETGNLEAPKAPAPGIRPPLGDIFGSSSGTPGGTNKATAAVAPAAPAAQAQGRRLEDVNREITELNSKMKENFGANTSANKDKLAALLAEKKAIGLGGGAR